MTFSIWYMFIDVIFICILWETLGHLHGDLHLSHLGRLWPLHGSDGDDGDRDPPLCCRWEAVIPIGTWKNWGKNGEKTWKIAWKSHRNHGNDMEMTWNDALVHLVALHIKIFHGSLLFRVAFHCFGAGCLRQPQGRQIKWDTRILVLWDQANCSFDCLPIRFMLAPIGRKCHISIFRVTALGRSGPFCWCVKTLAARIPSPWTFPKSQTIWLITHLQSGSFSHLPTVCCILRPATRNSVLRPWLWTDNFTLEDRTEQTKSSTKKWIPKVHPGYKIQSHVWFKLTSKWQLERPSYLSCSTFTCVRTGKWSAQTHKVRWHAHRTG